MSIEHQCFLPPGFEGFAFGAGFFAPDPKKLAAISLRSGIFCLFGLRKFIDCCISCGRIKITLRALLFWLLNHLNRINHCINEIIKCWVREFKIGHMTEITLNHTRERFRGRQRSMYANVTCTCILILLSDIYLKCVIH